MVGTAGFLIFVPVLISLTGQRAIKTVVEVDKRVVIIFGAGLRADGEPSDMLRDRLQVGAELVKVDKALAVIVSGDNRFENYNEPQVMHDTLVTDFGVPDDLITLDFAGRRTYDTCIRAKTIWKVDSAILVTQKYHLPRALWTCGQLGIDSLGVSATLQPYLHDVKFKLREILADYKAVIDVFVWSPDYVNGEVLSDLDYVTGQ